VEEKLKILHETANPLNE